MDRMKLYKFRPLAKEKDFQRAKSIVETGHFWCSLFSKLNDPMEGIYRTTNHEIIDYIYEQKKLYKICSFSAEAAFENPCMWGYYANGFKGIAIEIEVDDGEVEKINYKNNIPKLKKIKSNNNNDDGKIKKILTSKLKSWKHEAEYRFLKKSEENEHEHCIGKITAVYFGEPYRDIFNKETVYGENMELQCYQCLGKKLITIAQNEGIECFYVKIEKGKVKKGVKNLTLRPDKSKNRYKQSHIRDSEAII